MMRPIVTVDFETEAIRGGRPDYPPEPVGVAIRWPDGDAGYMSWGHPGANNSEPGAARAVLADLWEDERRGHGAQDDAAEAAVGGQVGIVPQNLRKRPDRGQESE